MSVATRLLEYKFREFDVIVARKGDEIIAIGRDSKTSKQVAHISTSTVEDADAQIKHKLTGLSADFFGVEGAVALFGKVFSNGFLSPIYIETERNYKDKTVAAVAERLAEKRLNVLIEKGDFEAVCSAAKGTLNNLVFPNERMAFSDAVKTEGVAEAFTRSLRDMLYGNFNIGFENMVAVLEPYSAAKWTLITFWSFFRHPDKHMFVKPSIYQNCAKRMGFDAMYEPKPNLKTYTQCLSFVDFLRPNMTKLRPKDNIDLQSFMFIVGDPKNTKAVIATERP
jgi:hypothetical protein